MKIIDDTLHVGRKYSWYIVILIHQDYNIRLHFFSYITIFIAIVMFCESAREISKISDKMSHEGSNLD